MSYGYHMLGENKYERCKITVEDFVVLRAIGDGGYSKVYLVRKQGTMAHYAMKKMRKMHVLHKNAVDKIMNERKILGRLHHPFIVHLHYAFQTERHLYLVFDFVNGGDLFFHLFQIYGFPKAFREERAKFYAAELFLALKFVHDEVIIFRDLKPENVLIGADGHIKLADFGLAKIVGQKMSFRGSQHLLLENRGITYTFTGTPGYLAPEQLESRVYDERTEKKVVRKGFDKMVDWWAYGVLLFEMLTAYHPFNPGGRMPESRREEYIYSMEYLDFEFDPDFSYNHPNISNEAKDIIKRLLVRDPKKRIGYKDVNEIRNHPFFDGIDWDKMMKKQVDPPMIPQVSGSRDVSYFERETIQKKVYQDSFEPAKHDIIPSVRQRDFDGYSFACESWVNEEDDDEGCSCGNHRTEKKCDHHHHPEKEEEEEVEGEEGNEKKKRKKKKKKVKKIDRRSPKRRKK